MLEKALKYLGTSFSLSGFVKGPMKRESRADLKPPSHQLNSREVRNGLRERLHVQNNSD